MEKKEFAYTIIIAPGKEDIGDPKPFSEQLLDQAFSMINEGAPALIVDVKAEDDQVHEFSLDALKILCGTVDVPVIGTQDLKRLEDVKKLLYAGCRRVAFRQDNASERSELFQEAQGRFGAERLARLSEAGTLMEAEEDKELVFPSRTLKAAFTWAQLKKNSDGLVPVVVQDNSTDEVLMVAYMNEEAFQMTLETGRMTYYSRSRRELWIKGLTSGHYQYVRSLSADCDLDTILARVRQIGAACHTGKHSCFFNTIAESAADGSKNARRILDDVYAVIADRKEHPKKDSYTNYLFDKGIDKILKKCGEEATEIVIAAKNPNENEIIYEISDLLYHLMVLMVEKGVTWEDIADELAKR